MTLSSQYSVRGREVAALLADQQVIVVWLDFCPNKKCLFSLWHLPEEDLTDQNVAFKRESNSSLRGEQRAHFFPCALQWYIFFCSTWTFYLDVHTVIQILVCHKNIAFIAFSFYSAVLLIFKVRLFDWRMVTWQSGSAKFIHTSLGNTWFQRLCDFSFNIIVAHIFSPVILLVYVFF